MAKQCCVCKRKLGFLDSGFELGGISSGYVLCSDCNIKKLDLRVAQTEQEMQKKIDYFASLMNDPHTPIEVIQAIESMAGQGMRMIGKRDELERREEEAFERIKSEGYAFSTEMRTLMESYQSNVTVYKNKVVVKRVGKTSLPAESTIYFRDATAVSWGNSSGRSWISFTVPGATSLGRSAVVTSNTIAVGFSGPNIPYEDSFSIVFGLNQANTAKNHFGMIKKVFDEFKDNNSEKPVAITTIQQDNAVDKLKKLKELKDLGILNDAEYEEKRQKLLAEI